MCRYMPVTISTLPLDQYNPQFVSEILMDWSCECLGKYIGYVVVGLDVKHVDSSFVHMIP